MTEKPYDVSKMQRYDTREFVDISEFCKKISDEGKAFDVYIGTDSQFKNGEAHFTTVVAFRFGDKGVRGAYRTLVEKTGKYELYSKKLHNKKRKSDSDRKKTLHHEIYERLRKETYLSLETANLLKDVLNIKQIDLDYNSKVLELSNKVVQECQNLCKAYGFKVSLKGQEQVATHFADKICK
jgi:predicted RNase H-related nuclease YkuK (DUF458 family)